MADVFISYSQRAKEATETLARELADLGYSVWYDSSLLPTDMFWKVLMQKITQAKAVIVIWSKASVESEWVYAAANLAYGQGKRDGVKKLICTRTADVPPEDVPLPFNGMNVTAVENRAKILEALAAIGVPRASAPGARTARHQRPRSRSR